MEGVCSLLNQSFIMKYLFWNRTQEITKVFCHKSLELYGSYAPVKHYLDGTHIGLHYFDKILDVS